MILPIALAAGALLGTAAVAVVVGLHPPLTRLDHRIARVLTPHAPTAEPSHWRRWRQTLIAHTPASIGPDLALLGRTPGQFLTTRMGWAATGLATATLAAGIAGAPPYGIPLVGLVGAATGWYLVLHEIRDAAAKRRRTLGLALAAWTQMAAMMIRAGLGVEQAMRQAAAAGSHWTFQSLHDALARAVDDRRPLWHALADLGETTDVTELRQLATELRLTETVGGTPTEALLVRARVLRETELADLLAAAKTAEVKQAIPLSMLGLCLTGFVVYPAVEAFLAT